MKGFFRYIPPFAPDYSGAVSALYNAGGMLVLCDPGGCSGNVAGYDEPRFYGTEPEFFSAAIREMDTIFGRDDRLEQKIERAAAVVEPPAFIALIGTPVVSVIGTDLAAVARKVEAATGIPAFAVETSGMEDYTMGEYKAIKAYLGRLGASSDTALKPGGKAASAHRGLFGVTPLNAAGEEWTAAEEHCACGGEAAGRCDTAEGERGLVRCCSAASCLALSAFAEADAAAGIASLGSSVANASPGPLTTELKPVLEYPQTQALERVADETVAVLRELCGRSDCAAGVHANAAGGSQRPAAQKRILILHHFAAADTLRRMIAERLGDEPGAGVTIDVGSFFAADHRLMKAGAAEAVHGRNICFNGEDELCEVSENCILTVCDPLYGKAVRSERCIALPHRAMSGDLYI